MTPQPAPNPMVTLNRAIALAETKGPQAGLGLLAILDGDERMARHHRLLSVQAHLLEKTGDTTGHPVVFTPSPHVVRPGFTTAW